MIVHVYSASEVFPVLLSRGAYLYARCGRMQLLGVLENVQGQTVVPLGGPTTKARENDPGVEGGLDVIPPGDPVKSEFGPQSEQYAESGLVPTHADRKVGGTDSTGAA